MRGTRSHLLLETCCLSTRCLSTNQFSQAKMLHRPHLSSEETVCVSYIALWRQEISVEFPRQQLLETDTRQMDTWETPGHQETQFFAKLISQLAN